MVYFLNKIGLILQFLAVCLLAIVIVAGVVDGPLLNKLIAGSFLYVPMFGIGFILRK